MLDREVEALVDGAVNGRTIARDEAVQLLGLASSSPEAAYVRWGAEQIARTASGGIGQIYAQIGVDANPCPEGCAFCTLSAGNSPWKGPAEVPHDVVADYAFTFDRAGAHLVSLMSTAGYDFDRFLDLVRTVRRTVSPEMPLMANIGDVDYEQARALRKAGVQAAYHTHRLGEGTVTTIDPARRLATFEALRRAGLVLMSAVEPVHEGSDPAEVANRMFEVIGLAPYCAGVGVLTAAPGTAMEPCKHISRKRGAYFAAVMRLCAGTSIPFGTGAGNVVWADAGTNPRGRDLPTDLDFLKRDVARLRKELVRQEWQVPARPLPAWFEGKGPAIPSAGPCRGKGAIHA